MNKLQGKVAIITGGASGLGEVTAHHFAAHGARAIVIADVQDEKGQKVAVEIGSNICTYVHCDVRDEEQVKNLVEFTVKSYGCLDIMFSNAGIGRATHTCDQTALDMDLSALRQAHGGERAWDGGVCEARGEGDGGRAREGEHSLYDERGGERW